MHHFILGVPFRPFRLLLAGATITAAPNPAVATGGTKRRFCHDEENVIKSVIDAAATVAVLFLLPNFKSSVDSEERVVSTASCAGPILQDE
jgi:hypothetical protein